MNRIFKGSLAGILLVTSAVIFFASPVLALPPDPDNAALLYYQGFLTLAQLEEKAWDHISNVARGKAEPDDKTREYINKCVGAIQLTEAAAKIPTCHWGIQYSKGLDALMPQMSQTRRLTFVLLCDARISAADGNYKAALERCLLTKTLARHVGDDTVISYLVSIAVSEAANKRMNEIIGRVAGDAELLKWLKNELLTSPEKDLSLVRPLKYEIEIFTDLMRIENVEQMARAMMNEFDREKANEIIKTTSAEILEQAKQIYTERMNSALTVLSTSKSYEQAYMQLNELTDGFDEDDPASRTAGAFMPALGRILTLKTRAETHTNAIMAGIEILLVRSRTGKLPDALSVELPKDAFSGKDFEYEKTKDGFILRCRDSGIDKDEINQYEFKLSK
ncbi:MAG: hypothetical protein ACYS3S_19295 [Planctomycetota bacterium]|jgi:hypothetical protein